MSFRHSLSISGLSIALAACGGGSSDTSPNNSNTNPVGYFRDANVSGLAYSSGSLSGTTDANGKFQYEAGKPITFKVGAIELGTVSAGKSLITPIDLTNASSNTDAKVLNRVRFLMALDQDGNPSNGISISTNTSNAAKLWSPINFDAAVFSIPSSVQQDIGIADGRTVTVPDATTATAHLSKTLACAYAGAFTGTASGLVLDTSGTDYSLSAPIGVVVTPTGSVTGFIGNPKNRNSDFDLSGTLSITTKTPSMTLTVQRGIDSKSMQGGLISVDSYESISGISKADGYAKASRIGSSPSAKYRFVGYYSGADEGVFAFDVGTDSKTVTGSSYSNKSGKTVTFSGQINTGVLSGKTSENTTISALVDSNLALDGSWSAGASSYGSVYGAGCQLN